MNSKNLLERFTGIKQERKNINGEQKREYSLNFLVFLKNPLWVIVILLIIVNFLLINISLKIGHDFNTKTDTPSAGLYKAIYRAADNIDFDFDSSGIIEKLDKIYWAL